MISACGGGSSSGSNNAAGNEPISSATIEPQLPVEPEQPAEPESPQEPEQPQAPVEPELPVEPQLPLEPETPSEPQTPEEPEIPMEPEGDSLSVSALFFKGPVNLADCQLFAVTDGVTAELLAENQTNSEGKVNFGDVHYQGTALITCQGGTYQDEATERETGEPTPLMRAVVEFSVNDSVAVDFVVSPYTEMAAILAEENEQGLVSALTSLGYNRVVARALGFSEGVDITRLLPIDLLSNVQEMESDEAEYGFLNALIAGVVHLDENERGLSVILQDYANSLVTDDNSEDIRFSEQVRQELGQAADFYTGFGSLINSALARTRVRQNVIDNAMFILPASDDSIKTLSVTKPIEQVRAELVTHLLEKKFTQLPKAPDVTDEMYQLGQALAFDKILSGNKDTSCLSCHHPLLASGDARSLSLGTGGEGLGQNRQGGKVIARHAQPLFNLDLFDNMFWDGRVQFDNEGKLSTRADASGDLTSDMAAVFFAEPEKDGFQGYGLVAAQAMFPVTDSAEMRGEALAGNELAAFDADDFAGIWQALMTRLAQIPEYVTLFEAAYPNISFQDMTFAHAANAIAAFEVKAFDKRDNPWQSFINDVVADETLNEPEVLSEDATRGAHFFMETGCVKCHAGSVTSDFDFHALALAQYGPGKGSGESGYEDYGRELVTGKVEDRA